jgi:lactoylglutathione lyase
MAESGSQGALTSQRVRRPEVKAELKNAWGYQGNNMNLPVANLEAAIPFYETVMGFRVLSRSNSPHRAAVLGRDGIQIGLAENDGDPTQDGCAFEVASVEMAFAELKANGLEKEISGFDIEQHDDTSWKVFYVVAPDGLCYWFGERQPTEGAKDEGGVDEA